MIVVEKEITGTLCRIEVNSSGVFSVFEAEGGGRLGQVADTLDGAVAKARAALAKRRVTVEVPFLTIDGRRGVATGIHASRRTVLATIDGNREEIGGGFGPSAAYRPDTPPAVIDRIGEVAQQIRVLEREQKKLEEEYGIKLVAAVRAEIDRAAEAVR